MKELDLTKLTVEELKSKAKMLRMAFGVLLTAIFIMVVAVYFL